MTEVTTMRTQSAGRIYPLKEIVDHYPYIQKVQHDTRVTNSASAAIRGDNTPRHHRDIKDTYQQATLINIVASVNSDETSPSSEPQGPVNGLSSMFVQRDRQISIPKPQIFMEVPQKFSKKKPIFNRKSGFQASEKEIVENKKRIIVLPKPRPISRDISSPRKQESIKIAVSLQRNSDDTNCLDETKEWISSPAKVKLARSNSPRHRIVTLKKKHERRVTTSIPTCEAIDILDATECITQPKLSSVPLSRDYIPSPSQDAYRAKSLPSLFPVKRRKSTDSQNGSTEKKASSNANPFKRTSVKAYGGMPNLLVGKNIQARSNEMSEHDEESTKPGQKPSSATYENPLRLIHKEEKEKIKEKTISINQEIITLTGRSIPNPRPSSFQMSRYSKNPETDMLYETFGQLDDKKVVLKQLDKHFEDLRKQISAKMSSLSEGASMASESSSDIASYNLVGKAFKSSLSMTSTTNKNDKQKTTKRVTFADDTDENITISEKSILSYDNDRALLNARLNISRPSTKERVSLQKQQSKSTKDPHLLRLKQKLMPGLNNTEHKSKTDFIANIRVSGMLPTGGQVRSSSRASDTNRSMVSEADTIMIEEAAREWNGEDIDVTSRHRTEIPLNHGASSFYPNALDDDFDSFDSDDEFSGTMDSYRVLKAIDLGKLSNYQHRKLKNVSHKQDPSTTHFVKVKVK